MKKLSGLLFGMLALAASSQAGPPELITVDFGAQWAWSVNGILAESCVAPNQGGVSCLQFPSGGRLWGFKWQSSVKVERHEVLLFLMLTPTEEFGGRILHSAHHVSTTQTTMQSLVHSFPGPVRILPGSLIWVFATGSGDPHGAPVEVQVILDLEPTIVRPLP